MIIKPIVNMQNSFYFDFYIMTTGGQKLSYWFSSTSNHWITTDFCLVSYEELIEVGGTQVAKLENAK